MLEMIEAAAKFLFTENESDMMDELEEESAARQEELSWIEPDLV